MKYFLLSILFITGCEYHAGDAKHVTGNYKCTIEQNEKVERETLFCNSNGGYTKNYCYDTAIMRNCEKINNRFK